jgi:hypothetical protein
MYTTTNRNYRYGNYIKCATAQAFPQWLCTR